MFYKTTFQSLSFISADIGHAGRASLYYLNVATKRTDICFYVAEDRNYFSFFGMQVSYATDDPVSRIYVAKRWTISWSWLLKYLLFRHYLFVYDEGFVVADGRRCRWLTVRHGGLWGWLWPIPLCQIITSQIHAIQIQNKIFFVQINSVFERNNLFLWLMI